MPFVPSSPDEGGEGRALLDVQFGVSGRWRAGLAGGGQVEAHLGVDFAVDGRLLHADGRSHRDLGLCRGAGKQLIIFSFSYAYISHTGPIKHKQYCSFLPMLSRVNPTDSPASLPPSI